MGKHPRGEDAGQIEFDIFHDVNGDDADPFLRGHVWNLSGKQCC